MCLLLFELLLYDRICFRIEFSVKTNEVTTPVNELAGI